MSNFPKNNTELYHQCKVMAPKLIEEISRLLSACRRLGIIIPKNIQNLFDFSLEDLIIESSKPSASNITDLKIHFGQLSSMMDIAFSSTFKKPLTKNSPGQPVSVRLLPNSQQILQKFQKKSKRLLSELLCLKLKMTIEASIGSRFSDVSKQFIEAKQLLYLRTKELILESVLNTTGMGKAGKQKISNTDQFSGRFLEISRREFFVPDDPCLEAQEKLREMCRVIEADRNSCKGKNFSFPIILCNYREKKHSLYSNLIKGNSTTLLFAAAHPHHPTASLVDTKSKTACKFHYTFYDGTTFVFYPSGHVAVCQIPTCCRGRYTTCIFNDTPNFTIIGLFTAEGHGSVQYNLKNRYPCMFMMNHEGGCITDTKGHTVHKWSWTSKTWSLLSLEYKMNEQIVLKVTGQNSINITFSALNETVTLFISPQECPHGTPSEKQYSFRSSTEGTSNFIQALDSIKKRFRKAISQFWNSIYLSAGLLTIDYPVKDEIDLSRFRKKTTFGLSILKSVSQSFPRTHSALHASFNWKSLHDISSAIMGSSKTMPVKAKLKVSDREEFLPSRVKLPSVPEPQPPNTWAFALADCPLLLRKLLLKQDTSFGCRCLVKSPAVTDLEFERFISASRDPNQILVLYVMSTQPSTNSSHLEWILDSLYMHNRCGRPSPCIQCRHDPYRLLRYNIHDALQKNPPLLVQKHAVMPGMILMFAGGKLLFGGFILNGYGCCNKKNLLKQIFLARQQSKMGYFLPDNFKFNTLSPFPQNFDEYKDQAEENDELLDATSALIFEKDKIAEEITRKDRVSSTIETVIDSTPLDLKFQKKFQRKSTKIKKK
ncbi:uncharacterized protein C3orf20 homolog isoform X2 [Macrotis lagotis]|uniref:uncharacterized protein C3orf20 homolog isoform X2 n=1 Tax=Macrotis lagotis TaxID=92651 RepID=UPI003D6836D1